MGKRIIGFIMAAVMALSAVPAVTLAEDETELSAEALYEEEREAQLAEEEARREAELLAEEERREEERERRAEREAHLPDTMTETEAQARQAKLEAMTSAADDDTMTLFSSGYSEIVYIETIDDLLAIDGHSGGYYELTNDLDLSGVDWTPLCLWDATFNGNGYTISNLNVTQVREPYTDGYYDDEYYDDEYYDDEYYDDYSFYEYWSGFICGYGNYVNELNIIGSINLMITATIDSDTEVHAAFMGSAYSNNCTLDGDIYVTADFGTEYGSADAYGIYSGNNCTFNGNITVEVTGVDVTGSAYGLYNASNSEFHGDLTANAETTAGTDDESYVDAYATGICGYEGTVVNSVFIGNITAAGNDWSSAEGINGDWESTIRNCTVTGNITATNGDAYGMENRYDDSIISGCTVTGDITATGSDAYAYGIDGNADGCTVTGDVTATGSDYTRAYGIYGSASNCTVEGDITTTGNDYANAYGICGSASNCTVEGGITATGDSYGIYGDWNGTAIGCTVEGDITGDYAYGIYGSTSNCTVEGDITAIGSNYADAYGIYGSASGCTIEGDITATDGNYSYACGIYESANGCTVTGDITATSSGRSYAYGIRGSAINCTVTGDITTVSGYDACAYGISGSASGCTVKGDITATCSDYFTRTYGIYGNWDCMVSGCTVEGDITGSYAYGIYAYYNSTVSGCTLTGNVMADVSAYGIFNSSGNYLNGNVIAYTYAYGISYSSNDNYLSGNVIAYTYAYGISGGSDNYLSGNVTAKNGSACGIHYGDSGNYVSGRISASTQYGTVTALASSPYKALYRCGSCDATYTSSYDSYKCYHHYDSIGEVNPCSCACVALAQYSTESQGTTYPGYDTEDEGEPTISPDDVATPDQSDDSTYVLQVIYAESEEPVADAVVNADGIEYITNNDGFVTMRQSVNIGGLSVTLGDALLCTKTNYHAVKGQVNVLKVQELDLTAEDFNFGNSAQQSIAGPEIDINGRGLSLFNIPFSMELDFMKTVKLAYNADDKTWQILLGTSSELDNFKDKEDADDKNWLQTLEEYEEIFERAMIGDLGDGFFEGKNTAKGFMGDVSVYGFLEVKADKDFEVLRGGIVIAGKVGFEGSIPVPSMPIAYFAYGISGSMTDSLKFNLLKAELLDPQFDVMGDIDFALVLSAGAGVGAKGALSVEIGLEGELDTGVSFPFETFDESLKLSLSASVYSVMSVLGYEWRQSEKFWDWQVYPKTSAAALLSLESIDDMERVPRDYLDRMTLMAEDVGELKSGIYPYTSVQTAALSDGRIIMCYLDDDSSRSDENRTAIYYSIYSGGEWSAPQQIDNDSTADFSFALSSYGNKCAIVWQNISKSLTSSDTIETTAQKSEICYAEFDGTSWGDKVSVTSGNSTYEYNPAVYLTSSAAYLSWTVNDQNSAIPGIDTTSETVYTAKISNGALSDVTKAVQNSALVTYVAVGSGTLGVVVDSDGDVETAGTALYVDGNLIFESESDISALSYNNGYFYFCADGNEYMLYSNGNIQKLCESVGQGARFVTGNNGSAIVYEVPDGFNSNLYASYLESGSWTYPVKITDFDKKIRSWSAEIDENGEILICAALAAIEAGDDVEQFVSLCSVGAVAEENLTITSIETDSVTRGGTAEFEIYVANETKTTLQSLNVTITGDDAGVIYEDTVSCYIAGGECGAVTVSVAIPDDFAKQNVTVTVSSGEISADTSIETGSANLETNLTITNGTAKIKITNSGCEDVTGATMAFTRDGEEIYSETIASIPAGESVVIKYSLSEAEQETNGESVLFAASVTSEAEETAEYDNKSTYTLKDNDIKTVYANVTNITLASGQSAKPTLSSYPACDDIPFYALSDDETVAVVNADGTITAVGDGKTTVTYYVAGALNSASVTVYVHDTGTVEILSADNDGECVTVEVNTANCLADGETAQMIIALYNADGELIATTISSVTASESITEEVYYYDETPDKVKVLLWQSITQMTPASYTAEMKIE